MSPIAKPTTDVIRSLDEQETAFRLKILRNLSLCLGLLIIIASLVRHFVSPYAPALPIFFGSLLLLIPILISKKFSMRLCGSILLVSLFAVAMNAGLNYGGMRAPAIVLFVLIPLIGNLILSQFGAQIGLALSLLGIFSLVAAEQMSLINTETMNPEKFAYGKAAVYSFATLASFAIGYVYEKLRKEKETIANELAMQMAHSSKMSSLGEMASGIGHEINNPLAIIVGKVSSLKRKVAAGSISPNELITELEVITSTGHRIAKIVSGLKSLSRNSDLDPMEKVKASNIIEDTLALCSERIQKHQIQLTKEIDSSVQILCRASQISQVILNLLLNSCDAIENQSDKWIQIHATQDKSHTQITITDSGAGIPKEVAEKINQPFFTTKPVGKGTGLGLSISQGIIRGHSGTLEYNDSSKNTQFVIRLPRNT